ncbi:MAG: carbohydrate-binding domain-containing protein, partial [Muribaculaceae bacterium]|nr:carbohydrate-binding domain-containing protein [Muribaculaceae bacterium]
MACLWAWADNTVTVSYNGNTATVTVDDNVAQYLTVTQSGAHVSIVQGAVTDEITYTLTGTSNDGEFYMSGSYKATIELNGLTLTNTTPVYSGAAVHIQNSKRINVKVVTGTTNTLTDAASGSQKGCLYVKGHAEFKQYGTLNIVGRVDHGIKAGEYISIKNATINVTSSVGDGISCNQYFLMESGALNISGTGDDGIQCDLDGTTSTGMTVDHEDEDSGNLYLSGGTITINCSAVAAKGIKSVGDVYISDNVVINVTTLGHGMWDSTDQEAKAACCLDADGNITISGGTTTLIATGSGGKGMKCDNTLTITGGNTTVSTSGGLYYNNGSTQNLNYTGNVDSVNDNYLCAPKGVKAGTKTTSGYNTTYSGGIDISGGKISVTTTGNNAEGIESKNYLSVTGGEITVDAHDDGINAAQDLTITDGYVYARGSNNDGIDANGNVLIYGGLIYAIGASSPEVAIDANSEGGKKFYFYGGTIIAIGGLERGSELNQTCYQSSSWSQNTWYSLTFGSTVIAFRTPASGGSPLVVSAPSTPTVKSGVTVSGGTSIFEGKCYLDATCTGGSNVSLSQYTSGGGSNPPGPGNNYTITATANPTAGGSVSGAGSYPRNATCTLTATANSGYTFTNWKKGNTVVSTNATYSFQVTGNASYVANFTQTTTSYTITATANPTNGGTVSGAGTYTSGSTATLRATANTGYNFVNWTKNGQQVSTNATYSFTVNGNASYVANFAEVITGPYITLESYTPNTALIGESTNLSLTFKNTGTAATSGTTTVTLTSSNPNVTIDGTGSFGTLAVNATATVSGFQFTLGSGVTLGSNVTLHYTATNGSNTWEGDLTITPNQIFTVTVAANNADYGTVTGGGEYNYGQSCTVIATPADGYMFTNWTNNGVVVSTNATYTFNVTDNTNLVANFSEGVMIGSGTETKDYLPSYSYYKYSLTEQIYTPAELGGAGLITSIAFYNDGAEKSRTYDFYMKATTKSNFTSKTDWIAVSAEDKVFSGSVTMVAGGWTTITFSTPFVYDGTSNVVLVADDNSNAYTNAPHMACRVFTASNQALYYWDDNLNFNPLSPPTTAGSSSSWSGATNDVLSVKNQLIVTKEAFGDCMTPTQLTATEVGPDFVKLSWIENGASEEWVVVCNGNSVEADTNEDFILDGLDPETEYTIKVRPACNENLFSNSITVTTLEACPAPQNVEVSHITGNAAMVTWAGYNDSYLVQLGAPAFMVSENFDNGIPTDWSNDATYPWTIVDGHIQSGNSGVSNSTSSISVTVTYPADGTISFDFWSRGEGSDSYDWDNSRFYIDGEMIFRYGAHTDWESYSAEVTAGTHTFTWTYKKDSSVNPTGDCFIVDNVEMKSGETNWSDPFAVENVAYTFRGLSPETMYCVRVQGVCDGTGTDWSETVVFTTTELELVTQTIELTAGYNWVSFYVEAGDPVELLDMLKASLGDKGLSIEANGLGTIYDGVEWFGDLDYEGIYNEQMYLIEVSTDCTVELQGTPVDPTLYEITINPGYNWIGFPSSVEVPVVDALADFEAEDEDMIEGPDGVLYYWDEWS